MSKPKSKNQPNHKAGGSFPVLEVEEVRSFLLRRDEINHTNIQYRSRFWLSNNARITRRRRAGASLMAPRLNVAAA